MKKNWLMLLVAITVLSFIIFLNIRDLNDDFEADFNDPFNLESNDHEENGRVGQTVIVDIKGEVNQPGVYEIASDARVNDVVILAGGFTHNADEIPVNLAQKVQDEMTIIVPKIGDNTEDGYEVAGKSKIRINYATQEEIESLHGIGPAKAQAIIQYREENGFFQKVEDLLEVSGIGEKTLDHLRDEIQIP